MNRGRVQFVGVVACVAGLLCLGPALFAKGSEEQASARTISVSGTGTASGRPDMAVVRLGVETRNEDVKKALAVASGRMASLERALRQDGVAESDIATVDYNVGFVPTQRNGTSAGGSAAPPTGYYRVSDVASVTVRELSKLGTILDNALSAGANEVQGVSFQISDPASLDRQARAKAFEQAHARALQIAKLAGVSLGGLLHASSGGSSPPVPQAGFRAAALAAPSISPGSLQVTVTIQVVYSVE